MEQNQDRNASGQMKPSIAYWCFESYWTLEETCRIALELGCPSIELVDSSYWPLLKENGLVCGLTISHWFDQGMNNPAYHSACIEKMRAAIDACAEAGFPNVLTFTGFSEGISAEEGMENCVEGYRRIVGYAEKRGVNLCLEMLNTRVDVEMKGHPGYQGDHTGYCVEIIKRVGSPRLKLLFDVYHVQIMEGDLIRRIREYQDYIGYYHIAGNPGRHEPDETQEINYRVVMGAIAQTGYSGFVGLEFIPVKDPLVSLREAVELCRF